MKQNVIIAARTLGRSTFAGGALFLACGLMGCVHAPPKTISIDSDPTGARVEVNGEDLGLTPTSYTVRPNSKGNFPGTWGDTPTVVFTAFPPENSPNLAKQTKVFSPSGFMDAGDRVPDRIFFDLHREARP